MGGRTVHDYTCLGGILACILQTGSVKRLKACLMGDDVIILDLALQSDCLAGIAFRCQRTA